MPKNILKNMWLVFLGSLLSLIGAIIRENSSGFEKMLNKLASESNLDPGLGLFIGMSSIFILIIIIFGLLFLFIGLLVITSILKQIERNKILKASLLFVFILMSLVPCYFLFQDSLSNFKWGFWVLSFGELVSIVGIIYPIRIY
jgi:hypothetical protein